jgi:tRNA 2-selenouridine synthase SelU
MTTVPEVADLFARLASHLKTLNQEQEQEQQEEALDHSILMLNQSLNLNNEDSRVRVLDTALSLMCFRAPQV